jgi:hypothetical protein
LRREHFRHQKIDSGEPGAEDRQDKYRQVGVKASHSVVLFYHLRALWSHLSSEYLPERASAPKTHSTRTAA